MTDHYSELRGGTDRSPEGRTAPAPAQSGAGATPAGARPIPDFQQGVREWMLACFGAEIAADRLERGDRFLEEALELAQTMPGFTADRAHALVDYVFGRAIGDRYQEVGGVMVTLAALCNSFDLSINVEAYRELARVWTKVEAIRAKQASKPKGSALPVAFDPASRVPADVANLVVAARKVWESEGESGDELDRALEAFASRVPYENDPEAERDHG